MAGEDRDHRPLVLAGKVKEAVPGDDAAEAPAEVEPAHVRQRATRPPGSGRGRSPASPRRSRRPVTGMPALDQIARDRLAGAAAEVEHRRSGRRQRQEALEPAPLEQPAVPRAVEALGFRLVDSAVPSGRAQPPIRARTSASKASPRSSKLANWSKLAQAGASSTVSPASASASAARHRRLQRPGDHVRRLAERRGEVLRRLADQVGLGDPPEQRPQRLDAALLRPARRRSSGCARSCASAFSAASALVALLVVDDAHAPPGGDQLAAVRRGRDSSPAPPRSAAARARGCAPRHRRRRRSGGCARPAASACRAGRSTPPAARRAIRRGSPCARRRSSPARPACASTEIAITGSPVPASSRMTLARKRPSFSSTPMIDRAGPPWVKSRRLAAK